MVEYFFRFLRSEEQLSTIQPNNQQHYLNFLRYLYNTYFRENATFHYRLWDHANELNVYGIADCTTNTSETINRVLNKNAGRLRSQNTVNIHIYNHKYRMVGQHVSRIQMNNLRSRCKARTQKYNDLADLVYDFAGFSYDEKSENLIRFLAKISDVSTRNDKKNKNGDLFAVVSTEEIENTLESDSESDAESVTSDHDPEWDNENVSKSVILSFYE